MDKAVSDLAYAGFPHDNLSPGQIRRYSGILARAAGAWQELERGVDGKTGTVSANATRFIEAGNYAIMSISYLTRWSYHAMFNGNMGPKSLPETYMEQWEANYNKTNQAAVPSADRL